MSAAASVVAAVVLGGGCGVMARGSRIPVRCGVERVVGGGERGGVVVGGGVMGSRIPVVVGGGSSVRYETSKSLKAGLGSRIPVMKGSSVRYVMIIIPSPSTPHSTPHPPFSPSSLLASQLYVSDGTHADHHRRPQHRQSIVKCLVKTAVLCEGSWIRVEKDTRVRYVMMTSSPSIVDDACEI